MSTTGLARSGSRHLTLRDERQLARDARFAQAPAMQAAARIEAAAFAAHVALSNAAMLSNIEAQLIERVPLGEPRYKAIVDSFTGVAASEIQALTFRTGC